MPSTAELETPVTTVMPFGIRINHPRNSDVLLQSVPGLRLRSTLKATRTVKDAKTGQEYIPVDQAIALSTFPEVPGMEIHVHPDNLMYRPIDPLDKDEALCERIRKRLAEGGKPVAGKIKGAKCEPGELDKHRMKTLVREMCQLVASGEAEVCKGSLPTKAQVDGMAGEYLLNPGSRVFNSQPVYEKDWDEWVTNLTRHGG